MPTDGASFSPIATLNPGGWKTFINRKFGYSVDYPSGWLIDPFGGDPSEGSDVALYNFVPPSTGIDAVPSSDTVMMELAVLQNSDQMTFRDWVSQYEANSETQPQVLSDEQATINGLPAITQKVVLQLAG